MISHWALILSYPLSETVDKDKEKAFVTQILSRVILRRAKQLESSSRDPHHRGHASARVVQTSSDAASMPS